MRRVCAWLLLVVLACGLVACAPDTSSLPTSQSGAPQSVPPQSKAPPTLPAQPDDMNPLTGDKRPADMPGNLRPVAVMVANNERALPQRGLAAADVMVETVTEGGITRLMAVYADYRTLPLIGPVRSTRDQFVQLAVPMNAMMVQIGSSVYARNLLEVLEYPVLDGLVLGTTSFWFDYNRAHPKEGGKRNEYCWYTDMGRVQGGIEATGLATTGEVKPLFYFEQGEVKAGTNAHTVQLAYSAETQVSFEYDAESGRYLKNAFGVPHADEDGTRLGYNNLVLLETDITLKPDNFVSEFDFSGGTGYLCTAGGMQEIRWQKGGPSGQLLLYTQSGEVPALGRGKTYIGVLPNAAGSITFLKEGEAPALPPEAE